MTGCGERVADLHPVRRVRGRPTGPGRTGRPRHDRRRATRAQQADQVVHGGGADRIPQQRRPLGELRAAVLERLGHRRPGHPFPSHVTGSCRLFAETTCNDDHFYWFRAAEWRPRWNYRRKLNDEPRHDRRRLDPALLTDAELAAGPTAWRRLDDPLPPWDDLDLHDHEHHLPLPRHTSEL